MSQRSWKALSDTAISGRLTPSSLEAEEQRYPEMLARAHYGLAHIALHGQNMEKAREHASISMRLFKQLGHYKTREVQAWIQALP